MHKTPHIREFSKSFLRYEKYSFIQKEVAKYLLLKTNYHDKKKILDIGCGSGVIHSLLDSCHEKFVGIDYSKQMLQLHPKAKDTELLQMDFDSLEDEFFKEFDLVFSSSSLQWSRYPSVMIEKIQKNSKNFALSIFCDGTFSTLREWLGVDTFLPSSKKIISILNKDVKYEKKIYTLDFDDAISQLRYIKKSGVSGGVKKLQVKTLRDFIKNYDKKTLEFEVLFLWFNSKTL